MGSTLKNAKDLAAQISDSIASIRQAASDTQNRIADLNREHGNILKSPVTREDYIAMVQAEIDIKADFYRSRAADYFQMALAGHSSGACFPAKAEVGVLIRKGQDKQDGRKRLTGNLRGAAGGGDFDLDPLTQLAATFLLRDEMKRAAAEAINAVESRAFPKAKPFSESLTRLNEISIELSSLNEQLNELRTSAEALGLNLSIDIQPDVEAVDTSHEFFLRQVKTYKQIVDDKVPEFLVVIDGKKKLRRIDPETGEATDRDPPAWNGGVIS